MTVPESIRVTPLDAVRHSGRLARAPLFLPLARTLVDISVEANRANPLLSLGRHGACRCFYCRTLRHRGQATSALAVHFGPTEQQP